MSVSVATVLFAAAITPGPNNFIVMTVAARDGVLRAFAPLVGIVFGTLLLVLAMRFGFAAVMDKWSPLRQVMPLLGAALLFYLGCRFVLDGWAKPSRAKSETERSARQEGLTLILAMLALQVVNPKTWVLATTVGAAHAAEIDQGIESLAMLTILIPSLCLGVWAIGGLSLGPYLSRTGPRRLFAVVSGGTLIAFAIFLLFSDI